MMENYLTVLEDSLRKKEAVLDQLLEYSNAQDALLRQEELELEKFDACVEKKDVLIQELNKLDDGFETLYNRIKRELEENKSAYKEQIVVLQQLIARVTEKSVSIQAQEKRNKTMVEQHFSRLRKDMKQDRHTSRVAYDYYKNMSGGNVQPQFYDSKQ